MRNGGQLDMVVILKSTLYDEIMSINCSATYKDVLVHFVSMR